MSYESYDNIISQEEKETRVAQVEDYAAVLDSFHLHYSLTEYYYQVGYIEQIQGWLLHISVIQPQVLPLLEVVIPVLIRNTIPFKIIKDKDTARNLLDGLFGSYKIGKIITIYPQNSIDSLQLAKELISHTKGFRGPSVLTDVPLGGNLYTRYGSFNPIRKSDASGRLTNYIYNGKGELVPDNYNIPFSMQQGIDWPFAEICQPMTIAPKKILHDIYKPIAVLKTDPRGDVIKALYLKKPFWVKSCVIKQGRRNMSADEEGRDIADRLKWQQETHNRLSGIIPLPKILSFFKEGEDSYLAMEFVNGPSLYNYLNALNCRCDAWFALPVRSKLLILGFLEQVIKMVAAIHKEGYVHRDITPVNFIIDKGCCRPIDVELAYSWENKRPIIPFQFGTAGFMSPEQIEVKTPTVKEDIYGLGATMVTLLIGIPPGIFSTEKREILTENLHFFIRNTGIVNIIVDCLETDPNVRPSAEKVLSTVEAYKTNLQLNIKSISQEYISPELNREVLRGVVQAAINGLISAPMLIDQGLWYSKASSKEVFVESLKRDFEKLVGLYEGISGAIYVLARARKLGFDISPCLKSYKKGWEYIRHKSLNSIPDLAPGLYGGAAGIALALNEGLEAGLLEDTTEIRLMIRQCLELDPIGIDVASGAAGQGIAALQCMKYVEVEIYQSILKRRIDFLLSSQQESGVWIILQEGAGRRYPAAGFSYGNTGITWFLLEYASIFNNAAVLNTALQALAKLIRLTDTFIKIMKKKGYRGVLENYQTSEGIMSIIMVLIKAYETTKDIQYREIAEKVLSGYSKFIVHENLTQDLGLTGIGEIYLEAYKVFGNIEWLNRASWVVQFLLHTRRVEANNSCHWISNNAAVPTADLMIGNSGIIHFLIRYLTDNKLGYRVLN